MCSLCVYVCFKLSKSYIRNSFCIHTHTEYSTSYTVHPVSSFLGLLLLPSTNQDPAGCFLKFCLSASHHVTVMVPSVSCHCVLWPQIWPPVLSPDRGKQLQVLARKSCYRPKPASLGWRSAPGRNVLNCHQTHLLFYCQGMSWRSPPKNITFSVVRVSKCFPVSPVFPYWSRWHPGWVGFNLSAHFSGHSKQL